MSPLELSAIKHNHGTSLTGITHGKPSSNKGTREDPGTTREAHYAALSASVS